jgi:hypothetical protein
MEKKKWKPVSEQKMKARLEELQLEEQLEAAWSRFCENCWEPLDDREVWINVYGGHHDGDPIRTYYCPRCIPVDRSRELHPREAPSQERL